MEKVIDGNLFSSTEYTEVSSAKLIITEKNIEDIKKTRKIIEDNKELGITCIDLMFYGSDVVFFDSTVDDEEREVEDFRHDCDTLRVFSHTSYFMTYNKYDSSHRLELDLEI